MFCFSPEFRSLVLFWVWTFGPPGRSIVFSKGKQEKYKNTRISARAHRTCTKFWSLDRKNGQDFPHLSSYGKRALLTQLLREGIIDAIALRPQYLLQFQSMSSLLPAEAVVLAFLV